MCCTRVFSSSPSINTPPPPPKSAAQHPEMCKHVILARIPTITGATAAARVALESAAASALPQSPLNCELRSQCEAVLVSHVFSFSFHRGGDSGDGEPRHRRCGPSPTTEERRASTKKRSRSPSDFHFNRAEHTHKRTRMHYSREGRGQMSTQRLSSDLNHVKREKEGEDKKEQYLFRDCAADLRIFQRGVWLVLHEDGGGQ